MDVKIASKAITRKLEMFLPELIHSNQNGFIKGRSLLDGVQTIGDALEFAKFYSVDFEKSFDSLNYSFLLKILEKFNFGTQFIRGSKPSTLMYQVVP